MIDQYINIKPDIQIYWLVMDGTPMKREVSLPALGYCWKYLYKTWCQVLQCHVWQFTEDVLFLKQHENKQAKTTQEFISKADSMKALISHIEEGRGWKN